jgi:outer membrane lipoprotein-sorting protein
MNRVYAAALLLCTTLAGDLRAQTLEKLLTRMDQNAASFKSMSAKVKRVAHVAVINEDNTDIGTMRLKRSKKEVHLVVELTEPDVKSVAFHGNKAEIYYPKLKRVEEYAVGKNRELFEQFFLVGFGTPAKDLSAEYNIRLIGPERIENQPTTHIELVPKSQEVLQHIKRMDLWISDATGYPVRQKIDQNGGEYMLVTYYDLAINPALNDAAVRLNLPKGVERVNPQK